MSDLSKRSDRPNRLYHAVRVTAFASALCFSGGALAAQSCDSLAGFALMDGVVTSAQVVPAGFFQPPDKPDLVNIPFPFCRVTGVLTPSEDSNIRFEVWLPSNDWNGKFNHSGNSDYGGFFTTSGNFMVQPSCVAMRRPPPTWGTSMQ